MFGSRRAVLVCVCAVLLVVSIVGIARAQLLTDTVNMRPDGAVFIRADLLNTDDFLREFAFNIPDNRDLILTDIVATCRTINQCGVHIFGPTHNASSNLVMFMVPSETTVSHAFNTGIRVQGGGGGQLFLRNITNPSFTANAYVTVTGYLVKK